MGPKNIALIHQDIAVGHKNTAVGHKNITVGHKTTLSVTEKKQQSLTKLRSWVKKNITFDHKKIAACHKNVSRHPRSRSNMSIFWYQEQIISSFSRQERSFATFATNIETVRIWKSHFRRDLTCSRATRAIKLSHFQIFVIDEKLCDFQGQGGDDATRFLQIIFGMY